MKLLHCLKCGDVFQLRVNKLRTCDCGRVFGQYVNNIMAEVSNTPETISIGIGNGSLDQSIYNMKAHQKETQDEAEREDYYQELNGKIEYAWVRPNTGKGNPHTKLIEGK